MSITEEETNRVNALQWADLKKMPSEDDGKKIWINAIAKIAKGDGSVSYCVVRHNWNGETSVIKDFGHVSTIVKFIAYYPYEYLKKTYVQKFSENDGKDIKIEYIKSVLPNASCINFESISDEEISKMLINVAIYRQINGYAI